MTSEPSADAKPPKSRAEFRYWHETALALLLVVGLLGAGAVEPRFINPSVQIDLAGDAWTLALVALPMAMIVITAGIDLSVGAMTGVCAVVLGLAVEAGVDVWVAAILAVATGAIAGSANALLVAVARIHPLIVTLATMAGFRGIALALTHGRTIQGFPPEFGALVERKLAGLPLPMWTTLVVATLAALFLGCTALGRYLYAIGHNEVAARYSGVPVTRLKLALYTLSGFASGLGAVLLAARYEQAKADFATGLELEAITAVVLGGISIFGGRGNIVGLAIGLTLLHQCNKFVPWHWHVSELKSLVTGGLLIGSVLLNSIGMRNRR